MNCKKAKKLMSAYIDDMISDSKKSAFEAHLEHCESFQKKINSNVVSSETKITDSKAFVPSAFKR